ncbi:flavin-containing monooxygenase [Colletotrichum musicola]|uniref:Flavin-containing monooxygenase n=1 Tax=Colletotrichum musicola TaxID=2175873 RepID=A0A8H6NEH4_9PEZI|nr:flavin-containing monooxygenase [Colletotrichum musicola]
MEFPDYPPKADIPTQIYEPLPEDLSSCSWESVPAAEVASRIVSQVSEALREGRQQAVAGLFTSKATDGRASHWKDTLALTAHLRSFKGNRTIAAALVDLCRARGVEALAFDAAQVITATETLSWVDCGFHFSTSLPKATCRGKLMLVPGGSGSPDDWKIWSMTTWMTGLDDHPEDEALLREPSEPLPQEGSIATEVLIIGGGNAGMALAGRLKAMDVDYVVVDRNQRTGDNWALRYDCMRFHVYKSFCELPYIPSPNIAYPRASNDGLTRDELAAQIRAFAEEFDLDRRVIHGARVTATACDESSQSWTAKVHDGQREREVSCKCIVLSTGAGFSGINPLPDLPGRELFQGPSVHSIGYRNAEELVKSGATSVVIVGSANTAFDVLVDCHNAGLQTTMVQRSETYVVPMTYFAHPMGLGAYNVLPIEDADAIVNGGPLAIGGPMLKMCHGIQAEEEPNRYDEAMKRGLLVRDSRSGDLLENLIDRCGGHFVDMGTGIELIATGQVAVRSGVTPAAYTASGLALTDGTEVAADAVVWCTGFGSLDVRHGLRDVLGAGAEKIAGRLESTWGVDAEGEIRGLYKRLPRAENLYVFAGGTAQHRWFSKVIALQIKGTLEGIFPEAYRETPVVANGVNGKANGDVLLPNL